MEKATKYDTVAARMTGEEQNASSHLSIETFYIERL